MLLVRNDFLLSLMPLGVFLRVPSWLGVLIFLGGLGG
jgi:hypothetical protein